MHPFVGFAAKLDRMAVPDCTTREGKRANSPPRVLLVDADRSFHRCVARYLEGFQVDLASTGRRAIELLEERQPCAIVIELDLPDCTAVALIGEIKRLSPGTPILVMTSLTNLRQTVEVMKAGAEEVLEKKHENLESLTFHIRKAIGARPRSRTELARSPAQSWFGGAFALLEQSRSSSLKSAIQLARKTAPTPLSILVEGESGTGKEIMARYLHAHSGRRRRPFIAVNVAAIPESLLESQLFGHVKGAFTGATADRTGKFELAESGTIFLDEIGDLAPQCQVKLLRVLQEREVERVGGQRPRPIQCRVIAATNKILRDEVQAGRFREDLYYRLNGIRIKLPSLRERVCDIEALVAFMMTKCAQLVGGPVPRIDSNVMPLLESHTWPGNIRELENFIMRLVATCSDGIITADDIPPELLLPSLLDVARSYAVNCDVERRPYFLAREQFERHLVRHAIQRCNGNKKRAALELGVSYSTVKQKSRAS